MPKRKRIRASRLRESIRALLSLRRERGGSAFLRCHLKSGFARSLCIIHQCIIAKTHRFICRHGGRLLFYASGDGIKSPRKFRIVREKIWDQQFVYQLIKIYRLDIFCKDKVGTL